MAKELWNLRSYGDLGTLGLEAPPKLRPLRTPSPSPNRKIRPQLSFTLSFGIKHDKNSGDNAAEAFVIQASVQLAEQLIWEFCPSSLRLINFFHGCQN